MNRVVELSVKEKERLGHIDLESLEIHIRSTMHGIGSMMLERLINSDNGDYQGRIIKCEKDQVYEFQGYRYKELLTVLGQVKVKRAYYYDETSRKGYCPKDRVLDIVGTSFSPGVRRIMSRVGAYRPFDLGRDDIKEMAGICIDSKEVERVSHQLGEEVEIFNKAEAAPALSGKVIPFKPVSKMYICIDGTGVPVVKAETIGRKGKGEDGHAKTREAKLGCVFTQAVVDDEGRPVRDESSTSYAGSIETAEEFGSRIYAEAVSRGLDRAKMVCVIGDGAPWIWNIADEHFPGAIQIIDLFHAREHYWNAAKAVFISNKAEMSTWADKRREELDRGDVAQVIEEIKKLVPTTDEAKETLEREIGYFERNKDRMNYKKFREQGLFVGSGVIEAGCKVVIGQRLKQSGMHWTVRGANSIIALRCCILSNRWEDFWENRNCA